MGTGRRKTALPARPALIQRLAAIDLVFAQSIFKGLIRIFSDQFNAA